MDGDLKMQNKKQSGRLLTDKGEIDLAVLLRIFWKKLWLILLVAIFCATTAGVITRVLIAPTYESGFTAFVNNKAESGTQTTVTNADTSAAESLANTYAEILRSRPMLESAAKLAKIDKSYKELNGMVSTHIQTNTQLVDVKVTAESPEEAYLLAKTMSEIAPDYLSDIVEGSSMKVVSKPVENTQKVGPSMSRNGMLGALLGALAVMICLVVAEITDTRIRSQGELEETYGYSVVGVIPSLDENYKE